MENSILSIILHEKVCQSFGLKDWKIVLRLKNSHLSFYVPSYFFLLFSHQLAKPANALINS